MMEEENLPEEKTEPPAVDLAPPVADLTAKWQRAVADYRNLEKRVEKERSEFVDFSNFVLIAKLLPVIDDLEGAVVASQDEGVVKILDKLQKVLGEEGLSEIEVLGKDFDATWMEGVDGDVTQGSVVTGVVRKGYLLKNRLLRPARVKVGTVKEDQKQ